MSLIGSTSYLLPLDAPDPGVTLIGGKARSLGALIRAGVPVPRGHVLTTSAYQRYLTVSGAGETIMATALQIDPTDPSSIANASRRIRPLFLNGQMPAEVEKMITKICADMGDTPLAVRSSATAEDGAQASFAGQLDSVLDVRGKDALTAAVRRCWASLWNERAIAYRAQFGLIGDSIAVVVQELVGAITSGVMFTADPMTGSRAHTIINATWGLGESLVSGDVTPDVYRIDTAGATPLSRRIGDKALASMRTPEGVKVLQVEPHRRLARTLSDSDCAELTRYGQAIANLYQWPMDIEWVRSATGVSIVQARPITNLPGDIEQWNDTLLGDYLWTSSNLGEAIPSVMTPITWSLVRMFMSEAMSISQINDHPVAGTVGGRFYLNLTLTDGVTAALGLTNAAKDATERVVGTIPDGLRPTRLPESRTSVVRAALPRVTSFMRRLKPYMKEFDERIEAFPERCAILFARIAEASDVSTLIALWSDCEQLLRDGSRLLAAGSRRGDGALARTRGWLAKHVDEKDVDLLLTTGDGELASLGPVVALSRLARGEMDMETYARRWGHRCPDEFEVAVPRPAEDPSWIERRRAEIAAGPDATLLIAEQARRREEAIERFTEAHPRQAKRLRAMLEGAAASARGREEGRSEVIRAFAVLRAYLLRVGAVTGVGDAVFWLWLPELTALLNGDRSVLAFVDTRRRTHAHYSSLPPYPAYVRGRFSPEDWAADPARRTDFHDADAAPEPLPAGVLSGNGGSPGVVEGVARVIAHVEDGYRLYPGEILVTTVTNVGWTPLFPRAAAVVTDVGAALSHAAIVARELGVPAVVGCGTATSRIADGDRIRVDGDTGTVTLLDSSEFATG